MNFDGIKKLFESVDLPLKIMSEPFVRGAGSNIVQMDIDRTLKGARRTEVFRIYPGHSDNLLQVMNTDNKVHQLVLHVKEPKRKFFEDISYSTETFIKRKYGVVSENTISTYLAIRNIKTIVKIGGIWKIERETSGRSMLYLMGLDERQLFIARLPKTITTVAEAHKSLKSSEVTFAEGRAPGKTIRQGEWFFVNTTDEEQDYLNKAIKDHQLIIKVKFPIGHNHIQVNSHVADEALVVPAKLLVHGFPIRQTTDTFVRGSVRHRDHDTVKMSKWRRVIRNDEPESVGGVTRDGMNWVD